MYLMYVDESGDPGLVGSPTQYFILSGLVVHELKWRERLDELVDFRRDIKARFGLKLREEIHAGAMLTRPKGLARIAKHHRLEILRRFADQLASMSDLNVINVVVDKHGKPQGYDLFEHAWEALIQRFENTISHRNFPGAQNPDDMGMLFPDRTDEKKLRILLRKMRAYNPVSNQQQFGKGYRNLVLRRIIEDANHRDSETSYWIQAADLCAFLLYQHLAPSAYMRRKSGQNYFARLDPILCKRASNKDVNGIVRL